MKEALEGSLEAVEEAVTVQAVEAIVGDWLESSVLAERRHPEADAQ